MVPSLKVTLEPSSMVGLKRSSVTGPKVACGETGESPLSWNLQTTLAIPSPKAAIPENWS